MPSVSGKTAAAVLLLSLLASTAFAAGKSGEPKLMLFSTKVKLDVDSTGHVVAAGADAALPEAIRSAIENSARRW